MPFSNQEFSFRSRQEILKCFETDGFDVLIIGGGITGAATARDAVSRGLKVALVEKRDFAWGTSSRSSKLIHGGLRYLENFEFSLVFEALAERTHLLKTIPHLVNPLSFYLPVYKTDKHGRLFLQTGLCLYDLLAIFRTPGCHRWLSKETLLKEAPFLNSQGLKGGFRYHDASMWDDLLTITTLRAAATKGAMVANYVEAKNPLWEGKHIAGFLVQDHETGKTISLKAKKTIVCVGPWTDEIGMKLSPQWKDWLAPSKGIHLVFDLKRIPVLGAFIMEHPLDGRISFVIPRPDYGPGVAIVGTTDGVTSKHPERATIDEADVAYLMGLLHRYFPDLHLTKSDIISAYVGVRPLMGQMAGVGYHGQNGNNFSKDLALQKVSREHFIGRGPGGTVLVAGGKYTTHRTMAKEIVDFMLNTWKSKQGEPPIPSMPKAIGKSCTQEPVNPQLIEERIREAKKEASHKQILLPKKLIERYGADALKVMEIHQQEVASFLNRKDPDGFPFLGAQLLYAMRHEMVGHLEDFYLRRVPLYMARADHGLPWAEDLARLWARERGLDESKAKEECNRLIKECDERSHWQKNLLAA